MDTNEIATNEELDTAEVTGDTPEEMPEADVQEAEVPDEEYRPSGGSSVLTIFAAIIGMIVGTLIPTLGTVIFGHGVPLLYLAIPVFICGAIAILGGNRKLPALIAAVVLTAAGTYLAFVSCRAAEYAVGRSMSILNIPVITISTIGGTQDFPDITSQSAKLFPAVFAAIGTAASWIWLYLSEKNKD